MNHHFFLSSLSVTYLIMFHIHFALLVLSIQSFNALAMMQPDKIQAPDRNTKRPSPDVNKPNPNLTGLSVHGKQIEEKLMRKMNQHPYRSELGHERSFEFWHEESSAEAARNRQHKVMQIYNDQIDEQERKKKTLIGKITSKLPANVKKDKELRANLHIYKQAREESREKMRNLVADTANHKKHGNFIDHDVQYITQPFNDESHQLGFRSNGRHISSSQSSPTGSSRHGSPHSSPSRSTANH